MLGYFPNPYPDEIFYSLIARYRKRCGLRAYNPVVESLFGRLVSLDAGDIPRYVDSVIARLPPGHSLTADAVIRHHSMLSYATAFLPRNRLRETEHVIRKGGYLKLLYSASEKAFVYYCPVCAEEQRQRHGEAYWACVPQLPGVHVCYKHHVWLEACETVVKYAYRDREFYTAEHSIPSQPARPIDSDDAEQNLLLRIAEDSAWLYEHYFDGLDAERLSKKYQHLLAQRGYATHNQRIWSNKLLQDFQAAFPPNFLARFGLEFEDDVRRSWLHLLVMSVRRNKYKAPLQHILLVNFLGYTIKEFLLDYTPTEPFGTGPWPCLNPVCPDYLKPVIEDIDITHRGQDDRFVGTFACHCGFIYTRNGPDQNEASSLTYTQILDYGELWRQSFRRDWSNPMLRFVDLQGKYRHTWGKLRILASEAGLDPERGRQIRGETRRLLHKYLTDDEINGDYDVLYLCRTAWLRILEECEGRLQYTVLRQYRAIYVWLQQNDAEWIKVHQPMPGQQQQYTDAELAARLRETARMLIEDEHLMWQVTPTRLAWMCGIDRFRPDFLATRPQTTAALAACLESDEAFAYRRLKSLALEYKRLGVRLDRGTLRSNLAVGTMTTAEKEAIIDNVMRWADEQDG